MSLLLLLVIIIMIFVLQRRYYVRHCFDHTRYDIDFSCDGVFEGEKGTIIETFENRKFLPLLWIRTGFILPWAVILDERESPRGTFYTVNGFFTLLSFERRVQEHGFTALKRGFYRITDITAATGDVMNNMRFSRSFPQRKEIHVYPRLVPFGELPVELTGMIGEHLSRRNLYEDLFFLRGIREYAPTDSFRRINWKASARTGQLRVNQYDYTSVSRVLIVLDCDIRYADDTDAVREAVISLAATLSSRLTGDNIPVGLVSNGIDRLTGRPASLKEGSGPLCRIEMLEILSRIVAPPKTVAMQTEMTHEIPDDPTSQLFYIFISQDQTGAYHRAYQNIRKRGSLAMRVFTRDYASHRSSVTPTDCIIWQIK